METQIKQTYKDDFAEYLLCLALDVGEGLLKNGAEIRRVEDTIERICYSYGAEHVEVFSIISVINAAVRMPDGTYSSQLRRVKSTGTNLSMLERFNALSREICAAKPELSVFDTKLRELKHSRTYSVGTLLLASAATTTFFAIFFNGTFLDALVAMVIGVVISLIDIFAPEKLNTMAKAFIASFAASFLAELAVNFGLGDSVDAIIIASIMLLVPGLAFGSAIRDLLYGDLLAGTLKTLQSVLTALMIAFGYMVATSIIGGGII